MACQERGKRHRQGWKRNHNRVPNVGHQASAEPLPSPDSPSNSAPAPARAAASLFRFGFGFTNRPHRTSRVSTKLARAWRPVTQLPGYRIMQTSFGSARPLLSLSLSLPVSERVHLLSAQIGWLEAFVPQHRQQQKSSLKLTRLQPVEAQSQTELDKAGLCWA